jgi:hypothetical protein
MFDKTKWIQCESFEQLYKAAEILCKDSREVCYFWTVWNSMRSNVSLWIKNRMFNSYPDCIRAIERIWYGAICSFKSSGIQSGLVSSDAYKNGGMHDHCISPQTVGGFVMDNHNRFLDNVVNPTFISEDGKVKGALKECYEVWKLCNITNYITSDENGKLKKLKRIMPTENKYAHLGIQLFDKKTKLLVENYQPNLPKGYTQWEKDNVIDQSISCTGTIQYYPDVKIKSLSTAPPLPV